MNVTFSFIITLDVLMNISYYDKPDINIFIHNFTVNTSTITFVVIGGKSVCIYNKNNLYFIKKFIYNYENVQFVNKNKNSNAKKHTRFFFRLTRTRFYTELLLSTSTFLIRTEMIPNIEVCNMHGTL